MGAAPEQKKKGFLIDLIVLIYEFTDDDGHHEDNSNTVTYWHLFTFTLASYNNLLAITLVIFK